MLWHVLPLPGRGVAEERGERIQVPALRSRRQQLPASYSLEFVQPGGVSEQLIPSDRGEAVRLRVSLNEPAGEAAQGCLRMYDRARPVSQSTGEVVPLERRHHLGRQMRPVRPCRLLRPWPLLELAAVVEDDPEEVKRGSPFPGSAVVAHG